jgi:hypothetical protein
MVRDVFMLFGVKVLRVDQAVFLLSFRHFAQRAF